MEVYNESVIYCSIWYNDSLSLNDRAAEQCLLFYGSGFVAKRGRRNYFAWRINIGLSPLLKEISEKRFLCVLFNSACFYTKSGSIPRYLHCLSNVYLLSRHVQVRVRFNSIYWQDSYSTYSIAKALK